MKTKWQSILAALAPPDPGCLPTTLMVRYVNDDLTPVEQANVIAHLQNCQQCQQEVTQLISAIERREKQQVWQAMETWLLQHMRQESTEKGRSYLWATVQEGKIPSDVPTIFEVIDGPWLWKNGRFSLHLHLPAKRVLADDLKHLQSCSLTVYFQHIPLLTAPIQNRDLILETALVATNQQALVALFGRKEKILLTNTGKQPITLSLATKTLPPPPPPSDSLPGRGVLSTKTPDSGILSPPQLWLGQKSRHLGEGVILHIKTSKGQIRFDELPVGLLTFVSAVPQTTQRGKKEKGGGQVLSLPDTENGVLIETAVSNTAAGKKHLTLDIQPITSSHPLGRVQVSLRGQTRQGTERVSALNGKAHFVELEPDQYTIEIKILDGDKTGKTWQLTISIT